jgi:hypothetical protein
LWASSRARRSFTCCCAVTERPRRASQARAAGTLRAIETPSKRTLPC